MRPLKGKTVRGLGVTGRDIPGSVWRLHTLTHDNEPFYRNAKFRRTESPLPPQITGQSGEQLTLFHHWEGAEGLS